MAAPAEAEGDEEALKKLEELVEELYRFRDRLQPGPAPSGPDPAPSSGPDPAPSSGPDPAPSAPPRDPLEAELEETLRRMEEVEVSRGARGRALLLRARALGVCPTAQPRAELALGRAVKLDPGLGRAWTQLGEAKWKRGDLEGARACFRGALQHGEDAEARRLLSMALRAGGGAGGAALSESLTHAEAAVRCDPRDGRSWYVLGNAYVSLFFAGGQSPDAARRALGAYAQAERVDPEAANNPDLHLNRATLLQYQEAWGGALEGLSRAGALAPGWAEPRRRHAHLLHFLSRLCALLANQTKSRGRRRRGPWGPLPPSLLGPLGEGGGGGGAEGGGGAGGVASSSSAPPPPPYRPSPLSGLRPGPNPRRALLGRVLFTLAHEEGVPLALGVGDGAGAVAALTVYNAAPGWGVSGGDAVAIGDPLLVQHRLCHQGQTFAFTGIRVPSPLALVVNGRRPPPSALAPPRLALLNEPRPVNELPPDN